MQSVEREKRYDPVWRFSSDKRHDSHCTAPVSAQTITVWTGEHDFTKEDGEENHTVCSKTEHPGYNPSKGPMYDLDIAILHLCQPLIFSKGKILVLSLLEVSMT